MNTSTARKKLIDLFFIPLCIMTVFAHTYLISTGYTVKKSTGIWLKPTITLQVPRFYTAGYGGEFSMRTDIEPETHQLFFNYIFTTQEPTLILDAGAHIGDTALWMAKYAKDLHKDIKIIAIDPNHNKIQFIKKMSKFNKLEDHIIIIEGAVGDQNTKGTEVHVKNARNQIISTMSSIKKDNIGPVRIQKIDDIIANLNLTGYKVGLIHLDTEGYEYLALLGAHKTLKKHQPLTVVEILPSKIYPQADPKLETIIPQAMQQQGFYQSNQLNHEYGNTIFYRHENREQLQLLKKLALIDK